MQVGLLNTVLMLPPDPGAIVQQLPQQRFCERAMIDMHALWAHSFQMHKTLAMLTAKLHPRHEQRPQTIPLSLQ